MLALPLWYRQRVADNGRAESKQNQKNLKPDIMDVTPEEVVKVLEKWGVQRMIHGHTHRPNIHTLSANGKTATRIVLGDWYDQGSVLKVTPTDVLLQSHSFKVN